MIAKVYSFFVFIFLLAVTETHAQLVYHDADQFQLLGKSTTETETRYERLNVKLKDVSRPVVWTLGKNTAGLAVRFSSDAQAIGAKWVLTYDNSMNHMAHTGIKGLDLYALDNGEWKYVNTARPQVKGKENEATIISNMSREYKEFMLYLPLYDGIVSLEIGVDSLAKIANAQVDLPVQEKPIVAYGTSILQGGCASRPGMTHTNMLSRKLNREVINLGFSGNALLDYEIAEQMAEVDASVFILDFMPNVNVKQIQEKLEKFYAIIRDKRPNTMILLIENPIYPHTAFDQKQYERVAAKNEVLKQVYNKLATTDNNVMLIDAVPILGDDGEATVDGVHFTDLGYMRYTEYLYPVLNSLLGKK